MIKIQRNEPKFKEMEKKSENNWELLEKPRKWKEESIKILYDDTQYRINEK